MSIETVSAVNINVMIVIDTDYVKTHYPNPSQDPDSPTGINHSSLYMICTGPRGMINGQGTADLNFKANVGDHVSFRGISIYGNSDDAIIVYGIKLWSKNNVFLPFLPNRTMRQHAVAPNVNTLNGLPAMTTVRDFISLDSKVEELGAENFYVCFALYTLANDGETQKLLGYYYWDPTVTVQPAPSESSLAPER